MDKNEPFVLSEVDYETPRQSPQSNQTWPMDKIRQSRFQQKMSSLLSPSTPKRNYSVSNAKSLLLQCLRDSKSDPLPRRPFPASYSDEGILMDGVLVTSATAKKVSNSLGRSARYSVIRSQHRNTEFSSHRSESGRNQETARSQNSSGGKGKMLANSSSTKVETPKAANPSKLQATAEPFILTPRSSQRLASSFPLQQLPCDHDPHFQWGNPSPHQQLPPSYGHPYQPPSYAYPRPLQGQPLPHLQLPASPHAPDLYQTHYLYRSPRPTGYQIPHDFNQSPSRNDPRISLLPTTPPSSHPNISTCEPPVHTSVDGLDTVTQKPYLSPSDELETMTQIQDLSSSSGELEAMTQIQDLSSSSDELETMTQTQDFLSPSDELKASTQRPDLSPSAGLETMKTEKDWSPSDDGLPTFTQAQTDFTNSHRRILPDDAFGRYKHRKRLPIFTQLCLDDNSST